jgi:hypothetical protein
MRWAAQCRSCPRRATGQTKDQQLSPPPDHCMQLAEVIDMFQPAAAPIGSPCLSLQVAQVAEIALALALKSACDAPVCHS